MQKSRVVVLDFDGTIADSEKTILDIYNRFSEETKWPKVTPASHAKLREGTAKEAMKWAGIRFWQLPKLLRLGRKEYEKHQNDIEIFPSMLQVVKELIDSGNDIYILSSNSKETVRSILARNKLDKNIEILKGSPIFGKHKILKKLLRSRGYDATKSWMVGDEVRDIEAAKKAKMNSVGVTWGLQNELALKNARPSSIAKKPQDILKILESV